MNKANANTPILMCHGEADQVVPFLYGKMSHELISKVHSNITLKSYPGMGHTSSMAEIFDIMTFLSQRLNEPIARDHQ
jgi:predicted esterase